ncbi:hypothetical protein Pcinc_016117 [Petrolisthes cinctipes]|uniref:Uncharacterized protein n=1 Tax=Petrolisthes cinctipes TaxID=88211 RepID=A0AAE1FU99_PETCI|nr:hypothetical protein Pcinc_016117 [Petrolisthes cinctipes]
MVLDSTQPASVLCLLSACGYKGYHNTSSDKQQGALSCQHLQEFLLICYQCPSQLKDEKSYGWPLDQDVLCHFLHCNISGPDDKGCLICAVGGSPPESARSRSLSWDDCLVCGEGGQTENCRFAFTCLRSKKSLELALFPLSYF